MPYREISITSLLMLYQARYIHYRSLSYSDHGKLLLKIMKFFQVKFIKNVGLSQLQKQPGLVLTV